MSDTTNVRWIYPPNPAGFLPDKGGFKRVEIQLTCMSDGTGETDVVKLKLDDLRTQSGNIPTRTVIERIDYHVYGMTVTLKWDRRPHETIAILNAAVGADSGKRDYRFAGGLVDPGGIEGDATGNIILTSESADSGDSYDITLVARLKD